MTIKLFFSWMLALSLVTTLVSQAMAAEAWKDLNTQVLQQYQNGNHQQARHTAEKALKRAESEFGKSAAETALSLNNLALIYKTEGKYDEATRFYERSLEIAEAIAGPRSEDLLVTLNNLATLYEARGDTHKADKIYERIRSMGHGATAEKIKKRARENA